MFIEKDNLVPIISIIAITLIVLGTAYYFKEPTITGNLIKDIKLKDNNEHFQGIRVMNLLEKDYLEGKIITKENTFDIKIYDDVNLILTIKNKKSEKTYYIKIKPINGLFEKKVNNFNIKVDLLKKMIIINDKKVELNKRRMLTGIINVFNKKISAKYYYGKNIYLMSNEGLKKVLLTKNNNLLAGLWFWNNKEHVIILDPKERTLTFYNIY